ncbi:MAG: Pvc16 family protein [bacterium]
MSVSTAIGMVSSSLRNLLVGEMRLVPAIEVSILGPHETGSDRRINLFLYKVQENTTLKNMDWQVKSGEPTQLVPPPLSLNLFYLMTPYAPNDSLTGNSTAHEILGEAMRVFYENPIVPQDYLDTGLQGVREQIKIMFNSLDMEVLSQVWSTFSMPFRLSILYEVSVVQLDMLSEKEQTMAKRVRKIGTPRVCKAFAPPIVEKIEPLSGPVGTTITFLGKNLSGWRAYVTATGKMILDGEELTGNLFTMTIPPDFPAGFYEIKVDISHLFRRTFFFEVRA